MNHIRIFILDDDQDAITRIEFLLRDNEKARICGSDTNPVHAIPFIRSNRPELILLGMEMPGANGFDVVDSIRESSYSPGIIFITGYDNYAIKTIKESAFDYLLKPVDRVELNSAVNCFHEKISKEFRLENLKCLSDREKEIFKFLRKGKTSKEISVVLNISKNTVDTHRRHILHKLGIGSTREIYLLYPPERN